MRVLPNKFEIFNNAGYNKPALLVSLQSSYFSIEQRYQADWSACWSSSNVDWTPTPPAAGEVILEQTTDPNDEENLSYNTAVGVYGGQNQQAWQSFRQKTRTAKKLLSIAVLSYNGQTNPYNLDCTLFSGGKSAQIGDTITINVPWAAAPGTWATFDFSDQNIIIEDDTEYWFKVKGTDRYSAPALRMQNTDVYANGQLDTFAGHGGWNYNVGDLAFEIKFTGRNGNYYKATGHITTQVMSLAFIPLTDGEWVFDDQMLSDSRINYEAWAVDTPTWSFPNSWTYIGSVEDGDAITVLKNFYRVKASFSANQAQDETPVLSSIKADFSPYQKYANAPGLGYELSVVDVGNICSEVDLFDGSTIGQIDITLNASRSLRSWLACNYPKNKTVKVMAGFVDERPFLHQTNLLTNHQANPDNSLAGLSGYSVQNTHTFYSDNTTAWRGARSAKIVSNFVGSQDIAIYVSSLGVTAGADYVFSVYAKAQAAAGRIGYHSIDWYSGSGTNIPPSAVSSFLVSEDFIRRTITGTAPAAAAYAILSNGLLSAQQSEALWWDGAQMELGSAPTKFSSKADVTSYNAWLAADRFAEKDFIDYRWGLIGGYRMEEDKIVITLKDYSAEWDKPVPPKWQSILDDVSYVGSHHADVILDTLLNRISVRDSRLDLGSFADVKSVTSGWQVNHKITGRTESAKDIVDQLRFDLSANIITSATGKVKLKRYNNSETVVASIEDWMFISIAWDGNPDRLINRITAYYGWTGSGTNEEDYTAFRELVNSASQVNYQGAVTYNIKDDWTAATSAGYNQIGNLVGGIRTRYKNPPALLDGVLDRRWIWLEAGDMVHISTMSVPTSDGITEYLGVFQIKKTELNFMGDTINITFEEA
jgi:hypothetical protein